MAYSQRDPRWAGIKLGSSNWTIGDSGCMLTALCNVAVQYGHDITPPNMQNELRARGVDTVSLGGADLVKVFPDIQYRGYASYNTAVNYAQLNIDEQPGVEAILKMDSNPNVAGIQLHFSRLRGVDPAGKVVIDDSWTGNRTLVESVYGNQEKAIWGCDFYFKQPATPPPPTTTTTLPPPPPTTTTTLPPTTTTTTVPETTTTTTESTTTETTTTTTTLPPKPNLPLWTIIIAWLYKIFGVKK